jgi:hypothetical protein
MPDTVIRVVRCRQKILRAPLAPVVAEIGQDRGVE